MKRIGKLYLPALIATLAFLLWGYVATQADAQDVQRGKALFNGKAVCFSCHGSNGDIRSVNNSDIAKLNPSPTDLREPTDKSVRQLYLILKYGIPSTAMIPMQAAARLQEDDVRDLISYLLALQGKPLPKGEISDQVFLRVDGEPDLAISVMCETQAIGDSDARDLCEDRYAKRYRDLLVGRPADIPTTRYMEIQAGCKKRFGSNLDGLARCYRLEYATTRMATDAGMLEQIPQKPADP